jgi:hypothetical protein
MLPSVTHCEPPLRTPFAHLMNLTDLKLRSLTYEDGQRTISTTLRAGYPFGWMAHFTVEITDETAIPRSLCSPDPKKIEHYLLSGKKLKDAKLLPTYTIAAGRN